MRLLNFLSLTSLHNCDTYMSTICNFFYLFPTYFNTEKWQNLPDRHLKLTLQLVCLKPDFMTDLLRKRLDKCLLFQKVVRKKLFLYAHQLNLELLEPTPYDSWDQIRYLRENETQHITKKRISSKVSNMVVNKWWFGLFLQPHNLESCRHCHCSCINSSL